jgi:hypothetical protein
MFVRFLPSISAAIFAAVVASAFIVMPGTSDRVSASAPLNSGKGDRLDIRPLGTQCSEQAWPYFEASCLRDRRMALGRANEARIVTTDRLVMPAPQFTR